MRTPLAREFGRTVAARRRTLGWSQTELASKLNTTHQTISRWELGWAMPDFATLVALRDLLEFSLDELAAAS